VRLLRIEVILRLVGIELRGGDGIAVQLREERDPCAVGEEMRYLESCREKCRDWTRLNSTSKTRLDR
jgi:hypothetical protein